MKNKVSTLVKIRKKIASKRETLIAPLGRILFSIVNSQPHLPPLPMVGNDPRGFFSSMSNKGEGGGEA